MDRASFPVAGLGTLPASLMLAMLMSYAIIVSLLYAWLRAPTALPSKRACGGGSRFRDWPAPIGPDRLIKAAAQAAPVMMSAE
jgi:hypothetical protein